jgi:hypothetical protein
MDVAPPPTGSRIQELGDRLIVSFRPRRQWGGLVFLTVWLVGWTIGGIAAFTQLAVGSCSGSAVGPSARARSCLRLHGNSEDASCSS